MDHLQELLDGFRFHYNRQRPHQGIGDATPAERYGTEVITDNVIRLPGVDEMTEPVYPPHAFVRKVGATGNIGFRGKLIQVGMRFASARGPCRRSRTTRPYLPRRHRHQGAHHQPRPLLPTQTRKGAPHPTKKCHVSSPNKVSHIIPGTNSPAGV